MRWWGTTLLMVVVMMVEVHQTEAAKILLAAPIGTKSHHSFMMPFAELLAQRNHTVTYVAGYELTPKSPNIQMVFVPDVNIFEKMPNLFTTDKNEAMFAIYYDLQVACSKALGYDGVQRLKDIDYDLVMVQPGLSECFLSFAHKLQVPFIFININKLIGAYAALSGSPAFPSLSASVFLDLDYPLTFTGRMMSTLCDVIDIIVANTVYIPGMDAACRTGGLCPADMPELVKFRHKSSLIIVNSVRSMENPTLPYAPTVVHAGGIQCRPAKPLPEDLEQWITDAGKPGVILFSLGSLVKPSSMPEEYRKVLVEVFASLQQRVLWKWDEDTMEGLPPNVRLSKWLPQQDILGHRQLRLFITHGGLFSTQEATYHGVPVLGLPVSIDQHHNTRMVQQEGWGRFLHWKELTYDSLRSLILEMMDDSRLQEVVQRRARVMRDQPVPPGDWATYWVEYVLRHRGAHHLRSPAMDIPWYQLYNVDVWAVVVVVTVVAVGLASWLSYMILRALVGCCCRSRKTKKD